MMEACDSNVGHEWSLWVLSRSSRKPVSPEYFMMEACDSNVACEVAEVLDTLNDVQPTLSKC